MKRFFLPFFLSFLFLVQSTLAHPLLPTEITEFLMDNPQASEEEFRGFLVETYGEHMADVPYSELLLMDKFDPFTGELKDDPNGASIPTVDLPDYLQQVINDAQASASDLGLGPKLVAFIWLGVEHIVLGPDHVLFVLTLCLVPMLWRRIWWLVTAFTIAHSLTFILAGTEWISLSGQIVEPIIALSIGVMAVGHVFYKRYFESLIFSLGIVFVFGLFHGLGFAGMFELMQVPTQDYIWLLLSFNIGVEIGQIFILLITLPLVWWLQKNTVRWEITSKIFAGIASMIALLWFLERVL